MLRVLVSEDIFSFPEYLFGPETVEPETNDAEAIEPETAASGENGRAQSQKQMLCVVPSPVHADSLRAVVSQEYWSRIETYSYWLQQQMVPDKLVRKKDVILETGTRWPWVVNSDFKQFMHAYTVYTELRSVTLDSEVLSSLIEISDEKYQAGLRFFHEYFLNGVHDEQWATSVIPERLEGEHICFLGFENLSGNQIDFITNLSRNNEIDLLIPKLVFDQDSNLSWVGWVKSLDPVILDLDGESEIAHNQTQEASNTFLVKEYTDLAKVPVKELDDPRNFFFTFSSEIGVGTGLGFNGRKGAKVSVELLEQYSNAIFEQLYQSIEAEQDLSRAFEKIKSNRIDVFGKWTIGNVLFEEVCRRIDRTAEEVNTNILKLNHVKDDELKKCRFFLLSLIESLQRLEHPRSSLGFGEAQTIFDRSNIIQIKNAKQVFCYGDFNEGTQTHSNLPVELMSEMLSLGPAKNSDTSALFDRAYLTSILKNKPMVFLGKIPSQIERLEDLNLIKEHAKNSPGHGTIKNSTQLDSDEEKNPGKKIVIDQYSEEVVGSLEESFVWSASSLQTYLDCPKKFYLSKVLKFQFRESVQVLRKLDYGSLLHNILKYFFEEQKQGLNQSQSKNRIKQIVREMIRDFYSERSHRVEISQRIHLEVNLYRIANEVIERVSTLIERHKNHEFFFEKNFEFKNRKVILDFVGIGDKSLILSDYKFGKSSIPTEKSFFKFEKIQLWFYINTLLEIFYKKDHHHLINSGTQFGYYCLSDKESDFFPLAERVLANLGEYREYEANAIQSAMTQTKFSPQPRNGSVCDFCDYNHFCVGAKA